MVSKSLLWGVLLFSFLSPLSMKAISKTTGTKEKRGALLDQPAGKNNDKDDDFDLDALDAPLPESRMGRGGSRQDSNFQEPLPDLPWPDEENPLTKEDTIHSTRKPDPFSRMDSRPPSSRKKSLSKEEAKEDKMTEEPSEMGFDDSLDDEFAGDEEPSALPDKKDRTKHKEMTTSQSGWDSIDLHSLVAKKDY